MDAVELLQKRRSYSKLTTPAPEGEVLDRILAAGLRAPDHAALRPWKVLLVRGDARAKLGELLAETLRARKPEASEQERMREAQKPLRAPLIVVVAASLRPSPKAPEIEQLLSAGSVAYGITIAAQAEGFGAIWRTGEAVYDRALHAGLGLGENDRLVGMLYVGTPIETPEPSRPALADYVTEWTG